MGAGKKQTIGYHYAFDILFGLSRGPLNELRTIKVGDKIAWEGPLCSEDVQAIRKPDLFGGEKKEGGIQGPFRIFWGGEDQVLPGAGSANCGTKGPFKGTQTLAAVKTAIGGLVSEFRGTTMLWFSGLVSSMNPYPKEWAFRVRRYSAGWYNDECWYSTKAVIFMGDGKIHAMNPAHIVYECLTNPLWGRGLPTSLLDENSFIYAANKLCEEGFGLCLIWQRQEEVDQFIQVVIDHIGAVLYTDPESGKMVIRLVRNDYVTADLPSFTPTTGLLDISEDDASSQDEIFSEVVATGRDPITNEDFQVRVHNLAARHSQDGPNPLTKDYPGIPTRDLMARVCQRDLKVHAAGLKKFTIVLDRGGWKIRPGMCFRVSDTRRGILNIVLRAGEITDRSFRDGRITIRAMQDVYGLPDTSYVTPSTPTWTPPPEEAVPASASRIVEANYRDLYRQLDTANLSVVEDTDAYIGAVALSPNSVMPGYDLISRAEGETTWTETTASFTGAATLVDAITPLQTTFEITGETDFADDIEGQAILVDNEYMKLIDYDATTHMVTVVRGVADTIPQAHLAAATIWTTDDDLISDQRAYVSGETVEAKALTRTASDVLDESEATLLTLDLIGRQARPYPPAKVTIDGGEAFSILGEHPEPEFDWVHRDRLLQQDQLVGYTEAGVGPEAGTTYTIRVYDAADPLVVIRTESGLTDGPWTYDATMQTADGDPTAVYVELESERDGLASYQHYRFRVSLKSGYGYGYGLNYGGA